MRSILRLLVLFGAAVLLMSAPASAAKNIIIMIGDGMGFQHVDAASYYLTGLEGQLCFEPYYKCSVTTNSLSGTTDSAAAATAIATGHKESNGVISQAPDGTPYETILEMSKAAGKWTGLVTTVPITHATPAGFGAHEASRNNYINIGNDYLYASMPQVILGAGDPNRGGSSYFSSSQVTAAASRGYAIVYDYAQMAAINPATTDRLLGLFNGGGMTYEYDRLPSNTEPHLSQMTSKALDILSRDADGFFLMVEGGMIDWAAHSNDIYRVTRETVEFHNAVQVVLDWMAGRTDTLLIVTADHETGGLTATNQGAGNYPSASWTSGGHTSANVPFYITGQHAFLADQYAADGVIDNTECFEIMQAALDVPAPSDIADVRSVTEGTKVYLEGKVVTAVFTDSVYVEDANRTAGIRVEGLAGVSVGDEVDVVGTVTVSDGECMISAQGAQVAQSGQDVPDPLYLTCRALGGGQSGLQGAVIDDAASNKYASGLSTVGLLVRTAGRVSAVDSTNGFFYLDDGSNLNDGSGHTGVRVEMGNVPEPVVGTDASVTGICGVTMVGGKPARILRPRGAEDVQFGEVASYMANRGFETGDLSGWQSTGFQGTVMSGTWYFNSSAYEGDYFYTIAGLATAVAGTLYQRVPVDPSKTYEASVWSLVIHGGNVEDAAMNRLGVDPTGGTDPTSGNVVWSAWDTEPLTYTGTWDLLSIDGISPAGGFVTVFLDTFQQYEYGWHLNAFDLAGLTAAP